MEKDKDGWYDVQLHSTGPSPFTGNIYPEEVVKESIARFKDRPGKIIEGEYGMPRLDRKTPAQDQASRVGSIHRDRTSHKIDLATVRVVDGKVMAKIKPCGPMGNLLEQQLQQQSKNQPTFGMRAFVKYDQNKETPAKNMTVSFCDIVTFDLVNKA